MPGSVSHRNVLVDKSCFSRACALLLPIEYSIYSIRVQMYSLFRDNINSKMATCSTSYMRIPTQHRLFEFKFIIKIGKAKASTPTRW